MSKRIAAIILAAGASTRLGRPKQLVRYQGQSLLGRAIGAAREAGCAPIITVLGAHAELCGQEAAGAEIIINDEWSSGMASSIRAGLQATGEADAVLLLLCDQPHLNAAHLTTLIKKWREDPQEIVCSEYQGARGVPAVFPASTLPLLQALTGDEGARKILRGDGVAAIHWPPGATDIDTLEDVERL